MLLNYFWHISVHIAEIWEKQSRKNQCRIPWGRWGRMSPISVKSFSFSCSFRQKKCQIIEFSIIVCTEFSDKTFVITVKGFADLLCWRPGCYHDASKTHVKLTQIHASMIYQIPWICLIHWTPVPFRENSNMLVLSAKLGAYSQCTTQQYTL